MSVAQYEAHQKKHGFLKGGDAPCQVTDSDSLVSSAAPTFKPKRAAKEPNKTEGEFGRRLRVLYGVEPMFEAAKLRIGPNCYYAPDWMIDEVPRPIFFEVKGAHIWDDSMVKFKAAKELHKWADFEMWQKKKGEWTRIL